MNRMNRALALGLAFSIGSSAYAQTYYDQLKVSQSAGEVTVNALSTKIERVAKKPLKVQLLGPGVGGRIPGGGYNKSTYDLNDSFQKILVQCLIQARDSAVEAFRSHPDLIQHLGEPDAREHVVYVAPQKPGVFADSQQVEIMTGKREAYGVFGTVDRPQIVVALGDNDECHSPSSDQIVAAYKKKVAEQDALVADKKLIVKATDTLRAVNSDHFPIKTANLSGVALNGGTPALPGVSTSNAPKARGYFDNLIDAILGRDLVPAQGAASAN